MSRQLALGVNLRDSAAFVNFLPGRNAAAVAALRERATSPLYLWGPPGVGKSHLLQAACAATLEAESPAAYLPLSEHCDRDPAILAGWESLPLVCLDDLEAVAGSPDWERALFNLYNALQERGGDLVVAAAAAPAALNLGMPDLRSRLGHGLVFQLHELEEPDRLEALRMRARRRGFEIPDDTANYLLTRYQRDMKSLCRLLDVLDAESLSAQRKLTIPFVRDVLPRG